MPNVLIINGHQPYRVSQGRLNASFAQAANDVLRDCGWQVRRCASAEPFDIDTQVENQLWADLIFLQFPLNSMGLPWSLKKYLDEVYTAGMDGRLAKGDGRSRSDLSRQYGSGGLMGDTAYALSLTLNAPRAAFDDPDQMLFAGRSLDELLAPIHINFAFFGLHALETFAAYDVTKAPQIKSDIERFKTHLGAMADRVERIDFQPSDTTRPRQGTSG
ncbi:MAG: NAD(P)H-dependent oxidoreductase [Pseudomonadota bacterium]